MLPDSRQDPAQRELVSSTSPLAEVLIGGKEAFGARGRKRDPRIVSYPIQVANKGGFVVMQHRLHFRQITVVGLASVPPLASIAAAHCGQMVLVTAIASGSNPTWAAC